MKMRDTFLKPMHPEGRKFVGIFAAITVVLFLIWSVLGWIGVGLTIWCYYFFFGIRARHSFARWADRQSC